MLISTLASIFDTLQNLDAIGLATTVILFICMGALAWRSYFSLDRGYRNGFFDGYKEGKVASKKPVPKPITEPKLESLPVSQSEPAPQPPPVLSPDPVMEVKVPDIASNTTVTSTDTVKEEAKTESFILEQLRKNVKAIEPSIFEILHENATEIDANRSVSSIMSELRKNAEDKDSSILGILRENVKSDSPRVVVRISKGKRKSKNAKTTPKARIR